LQSGLNLNKTNFELANIFPLQDQSTETYRYEAIWSPQVSILYKPATLTTFYVSASRGFSLPSVDETLTATGTINTDIKPETGYNFELGAKFYFVKRRLFADFAVYRMQIKDLLVAQRVADDQYVGINAGETLHKGFEGTVNYIVRLSDKSSLSPYFSGSIGQYKFQEFTNNDQDFNGNELPGVPKTKLNAGFTLNLFNWYLLADFQYTDKMPIDDANSIYTKSWRTLNLKSGYWIKVHNSLTASIAGGINNVLNERYASMILVNATSPPNGTPRYFYPGLPVNYYVNANFTYTF
ncbi:MAG TPA: TonB-dependent receptor, partial [Flavobacterium sp.]